MDDSKIYRQGEAATSKRKTYSIEEINFRKEVLQATGMPDSVRPYLRDSKGEIIAGGMGTATVNYAVELALELPYHIAEIRKEELRDDDARRDFIDSQPVLSMEGRPEVAEVVLERVARGEIDAKQAASEHAATIRNSDPLLKAYPPTPWKAPQGKTSSTEEIDIEELRRKWKDGKLHRVNGKQAMAIIPLKSDTSLDEYEEDGRLTRVIRPADRAKWAKYQKDKEANPDTEKPRLPRLYKADQVFALSKK